MRKKALFIVVVLTTGSVGALIVGRFTEVAHAQAPDAGPPFAKCTSPSVCVHPSVVLPPQGSAPKPLKRCSDADWRNVGGGSIVVAGPASGRVCFVKADGDRAPEIAYGVRTSGHDEQWACHANRKGHLGKLGYERFGGMLAR